MRFAPMLLLIAACAQPVDSATPAEVPAEPFTLAVFPDIQYVSLGYPELLAEMMGHVADEQEARNVALVLQEGDITHQNSDEEYEAAVGAFGLLGDLPYAVCVGNHDMDSGDTSRFNAHFGPAGYASQDTFGGQRLADAIDDHFHLFRAGGSDWLLISLSWDPGEDTLAWTRQVLRDHPGHRAIVLTHAYLGPDGSRTGIGEAIWTEALRRMPNVAFVLNGHYIDGEAARQVSEGNEGNTVHELFVNFQDRPLGGSGLMRWMTFDPVGGTVSVETVSMFGYAPPGDAHQFTLEGVDLGPLP